ncbi:hypothetical protein EMPS_06295 [Entomortierella parvispora]|uniref:FAD-binding domain-containing protein n=1 Tax=Entomortierella parvispora TaxID=205924 RepID=A0A9P3HCP3_9FUNG|nr:hypothetical protein EMPS_06295 [Entomortierella parvispora]
MASAQSPPSSGPAKPRPAQWADLGALRIVVVGAGMGGLFLGALLERMNIDFVILERHNGPKPTGGVMSLNAGILPVFSQLGIYEELRKPTRSYPVHCTHFVDERVGGECELRVKDFRIKVGYNHLVLPRPELSQILLSLLRPGRVQYGKQVIDINEMYKSPKTTASSPTVKVKCLDRTEYVCHFVVGADGAYSTVRQLVFDNLTKLGRLPFQDRSGFKNPYLTLVGTTTRLPADDFKNVNEHFCYFYQTIGKGKAFSWSTLTVPNGRICWSVQKQIELSDYTDRQDQYQKAGGGWETDSIEEMIEEVRDFKTSYGPTIGTLIDYTPRESISKVYLEEKLFRTWHHGKVVLIGDAAHKMLPSAGQGAVNAMQDCVVLANCIYDLTDLDGRSFSKAFHTYSTLRRPYVVAQMQASEKNAELMFSQKWRHMAKRWLAFRRGTITYSTKDMVKDAWYQPQLGFMPAVDVLGSISAITQQEPCRRYRYELKQAAREKKAALAAAAAAASATSEELAVLDDIESVTSSISALDFISGPGTDALSDTASELSREVASGSYLELKPLEITGDDYYLDGRFSSSDDGTASKGSDGDYTVEFFDKSSLAILRAPISESFIAEAI